MSPRYANPTAQKQDRARLAAEVVASMAAHRPGSPTSVREVAGAMGVSISKAWELLKVAEDLHLVRLQDGPVRGFFPADTPRVCGACGQAVAS